MKTNSAHTNSTELNFRTLKINISSRDTILLSWTWKREGLHCFSNFCFDFQRRPGIFFYEISHIFFIHGLINCTDTKAKCHLIKKIDLYRDFAVGIYLSEAHPLLGFCSGWSSNFVGSESGQIHIQMFMQNIVSNRTQYPHSLPATHCLYTLYFGTEKGVSRRVATERRIEGQQFTKLGRKHDWLYLQSIKSDKHLPQSPFTGQYF